MTEISQMENNDEVRSICFADALQTCVGNWLAGLENEIFAQSKPDRKFWCNGDGHFLLKMKSCKAPSQAVIHGLCKAIVSGDFRCR